MFYVAYPDVVMDSTWLLQSHRRCRAMPVILALADIRSISVLLLESQDTLSSESVARVESGLHRCSNVVIAIIFLLHNHASYIIGHSTSLISVSVRRESSEQAIQLEHVEKSVYSCIKSCNSNSGQRR